MRDEIDRRVRAEFLICNLIAFAMLAAAIAVVGAAFYLLVKP